jgi:hypothetical protein
LAKGVTYEAVGLIERSKPKTRNSPPSLPPKSPTRLLATDFDKMNQDFSIAASFVTQYGKNRKKAKKW